MSSQTGTPTSATSSGSPAWNNPTNAEALDGAVTDCTVGTGTTPGGTLTVSGYGFTIPGTATIDGIAVTIYRYAGGPTVRDSDVHIVSGAASGSNKADTLTDWTNLPPVVTPAGYGGPADTWGRAWTPAEINDSSFGVKIIIQWSGGFGSGTGDIDYVAVAVYYTEAAWAADQFPYPPPNRVVRPIPLSRSSVVCGQETTLYTEPTRAGFVSAKGAPPARVRAPGAVIRKPVETPPDQLPALGWRMEVKGQAPRPKWVPNRSGYAIPLERTPPFPDAWLTVNRRVVRAKVRSRPPATFLPSLEQFPPDPDSWLTVIRRGRPRGRFTPRPFFAFVTPPPDPILPFCTHRPVVRPKVRAGSTRIAAVSVEAVSPFQYPVTALRTGGRRPALRLARTAVRFVPPQEVSFLPVVVGSRPRFRVGRGSVKTFAPNIGAVPMPGFVVKTGGGRRTTSAPTRVLTQPLETISTGIVPIGWLRATCGRQIVLPFRVVSSHFFSTLQTLSTAIRQDNRDSRGGSRGVTSTAGSGFNRSSSGVGTRG